MKPGGQRAKGRAFEQWVAQRYREKWPHLTVRRSMQAHQAFEPDVVIEGDKAPLIWTECHHGSVNPHTKYEQALRDLRRLNKLGHMPIVVFKRNGQRRASVLAQVYPLNPISFELGKPPLLAVLDFDDWLERL